jgi:hypothetical protein
MGKLSSKKELMIRSQDPHFFANPKLCAQDKHFFLIEVKFV